MRCVAIANTFVLSLLSLLCSVCLGVALGALSAVKKYTIVDQVISVIAFTGVSIPVFWFGIVLILVFSVNLRWLPAAGMYTIGAPKTLSDQVLHLIMPVAVLSLTNLAVITRYTRSSLLGVLNEDYIRTAQSKGLSDRKVLFRHAMRNALIPIVTVIGLRMPILFGGTVITESVFAWPGMGRLGVNACLQRDYPVIMGVTVVMATVVLLTNLFDRYLVRVHRSAGEV